MSLIFGIDDCRAELDRILADAAASIQAAATPASVDKAADRLTRFTNQSMPQNPDDAGEVAAIAKLDTFAQNCADELRFGAIANAVGTIQARAAQLVALSATIKSQSLANLKDADRIRLVPIVESIDALTDVVNKVKVLGKSLDNNSPEQADIAARINTFVEGFDDVRTALARLAQAAGD